MVLGEILSNIQIDRLGTVAKMFSFFEFLGSYKNIVTLLGLFFVIISVISVSFFFRSKDPEEIEKECCLAEDPRHLFKLDCGTVFKKRCPLHKACVWEFVDSILKCVKLIILSFFYPKVHNQTINFFFSCKSAYNCKDG